MILLVFFVGLEQATTRSRPRVSACLPPARRRAARSWLSESRRYADRLNQSQLASVRGRGKKNRNRLLFVLLGGLAKQKVLDEEANLPNTPIVSL